jgi:hypothetical protein
MEELRDVFFVVGKIFGVGVLDVDVAVFEFDED